MPALAFGMKEVKKVKVEKKNIVLAKPTLGADEHYINLARLWSCDGEYEVKKLHGRVISFKQITPYLEIVATITPKPVLEWGTVYKGLNKFSQNALGYSSADDFERSLEEEYKMKLVDSKGNDVCGASGILLGKYLILSHLGCRNMVNLPTFMQKLEAFACAKNAKVLALEIASDNSYFRAFSSLGYKIKEKSFSVDKNCVLYKMLDNKIEQSSKDEYKLAVSCVRPEDEKSESFFSKDLKDCVQELESKEAEPDLYTQALVRDFEGNVLGGCLGKIYLKEARLPRIYIDALWLDSSLRCHGLGSKLMSFSENFAVRLGCKIATLGTCDFQAPKFYPKLGYMQYSRTEDLLRGADGRLYGVTDFCKKLR